MDTPLLWHFAISHFTEKARWALDWKGIPHRRKMLFLDYPVRVFLRTGQMSLPVLFVQGRAITDSSRIIEWLESVHPEPALYPKDEEERRRALALEDFFDEELGPHIRVLLVHEIFERGGAEAAEAFGMGQSEGAKRALRSVFPIFRVFYEYRHRMSPANIERAREKLAIALERLESEIRPSGYLVGDRFSVADLTAASLFYPIAFPPEYPYPFPTHHRDAVDAFVSSMSGCAAQRYVLDMYRRHRGDSAEIAGAQRQRECG